MSSQKEQYTKKVMMPKKMMAAMGVSIKRRFLSPVIMLFRPLAYLSQMLVFAILAAV